MKRSAFSLVCLLTLNATMTWAAGLLIPSDESVPPLSIESQRVDIQIRDGTATVRVEQVFRNSVNRNLEAVYLFPLPEQASLSDFAMMIDGKRVRGELVEKDKARRTYEDIVRRMKDPGLLEHLGDKLFRVSVFPVPANGLQKIELEYAQTLAVDDGLYSFLYPLKTSEKASRTLADFTVTVRINSSIPLKSIYSPSHQVGIARHGDKEATLGFEENRYLLDRDFVLYYTVSQKDFGLNLLTHADRDENGFFMMMLAPSVVTPETMAKDVTFVFDSSGSMAGTKIEQTRKALAYCVNQLHEGDRFNIVGFSTEASPFRETLVDINETSRKEALAFIGGTEARGGTAMNEALELALAMPADTKRPALILLLTDGRPTIGETDPETILKNTAKLNTGGARIFVFGVGEDVNAHLLDQLAGRNGGFSQYVEPNEDIEVKVSRLVDKMSHPVLTDVRVVVDDMKISMMYPSTLPDLFRGDQLTLMGRYTGNGDSVIRLVGEVNGKKHEFVYEGTFPASNPDHSFIPRLWATRRVGFLLDEIRLRGENAELKEEVVRLSRQYGIMTPYTSFLVLDPGTTEREPERSRVHGFSDEKSDDGQVPLKLTLPKPQFMGTPTTSERRNRETGDGRGGQVAPVFSLEGGDIAAATHKKLRPEATIAADRSASPEENGLHTVPGNAADLSESSGTRAIAMSQAISQYKGRENAANEIATVKQVGKKVFTLIGDRWIDNAFKKEYSVLRVTFGSDAYFKLLRDKPELKEFLALGAKITVVLEDHTALVVE